MMNKPTVVSSGECRLPISVWERKADNRTASAHRHDLGKERHANIYVSNDRGVSCSLCGQAIVPTRVFDEPLIVERRDGKLWMLVRAAYGIEESASSYQGKTWSEGKKSSILHVNSRFLFDV